MWKRTQHKIKEGKNVKWSHYRPSVAQRVGRGISIALLFHDRGTRRGWVVSSTPRPHFTLGKDPVPILQEAGWAPGPVWMGRKSHPHLDSISDCPAIVSRYSNWATQPTYSIRYFYIDMKDFESYVDVSTRVNNLTNLLPQFCMSGRLLQLALPSLGFSNEHSFFTLSLWCFKTNAVLSIFNTSVLPYA